MQAEKFEPGWKQIWAKLPTQNEVLHFETENPVVPVLAEKLREEFPDLEISVLEQDIPVETFFPDILR